MPRARPYSHLELTARFDRSYQRLSPEMQQQCDDALEQLVTGPLAPGLHLKPIRPSNRYWEARVSKSIRLILLPMSGMAYVIDVVTHDEIAKWGTSK